MTADEIISEIESLQMKLIVPGKWGPELNDPVTLSETIVKMRILLIQLVDRASAADIEFKRTRAARYNQMLKDGVKRSPASESLRYDEDLIQMENTAERLRNYMKYVDGLVSSVQSQLKVQSSADKNQY